MKTFRFTLVNIAMVSILATCTMAHGSPIMYLPNNADGKIVLTDEPCVRGNGKGLLAYTTGHNMPTQLGCWTNDDLAVHIMWEGTDLRSYDYQNWVVVKKDKSTL